MNNFSKNKVFFLHIPKTAGTTFKNVLYSYFPNNEICPIWDEVELNRVENLRRFSLFHGHFNYENLMLMPDNIIKMTFLREPFERVKSQYFYERSLSPEQLAGLHDEARQVATLAKTVSFEEYICSESKALDRMTSNIQARKLALSTNYDLNYFSSNQLTKLAKVHLKQFDYFGIVDFFDASMNKFSEKFELESIKYEVKNQTPLKNQKNYDFLLEHKLVRQRLEADCELFSFAKEIF